MPIELEMFLLSDYVKKIGDLSLKGTCYGTMGISLERDSVMKTGRMNQLWMRLMEKTSLKRCILSN